MKQQKDQRHLAINVDLEKLLKFLERTDVLRRQEWGGVTLTKIGYGGYRIKEAGGHFIDVMPMFVNWRVVTSRTDRPGWPERGWCYQGTGLAGFVPAMLAAIAWDGSDDTEPPGYFKRSGEDIY